jgi:transcriptional regulator of acetoin/glycerol metabolism
MFEMPSYSIPSPQILKKEIAASHERCRRYGVNPLDRCNSTQKKLSYAELRKRLDQNRDFLDIATDQIGELYQFVAGASFAVNIADKEGYILHIIGDESTLTKLAAGNCRPGFRWTEKDVGTSVLSLALERQIPVQINDDEHYCQRGHGHTCSASPVFGVDNELIGVISMSGDAELVHPHTLGMVITAARAIENQLRIQNTSKELRLQNNYMHAIINSIDSGVLAIDKNGLINQINDQGKKILHWKRPLEGVPLFEVFGDQFSISAMMQPEFEFIDQEVFIHGAKRAIQLLCTVKPIFNAGGTIQGSILVFNEIKRIRKLLNEMAGAQARFTFNDIMGVSPVIEEAKRLAMIAATSNSSVLLLGDTGTGKELFAQAIHNQSMRRERPFLAINCGAIPRELLESELFGYAEGSFTGGRKGGRPGKFELADGGTIFLDEIGEMPADMQVKLLRVLQTGEVCRIGEHKSISIDVRIIAATNARIRKEIDQKNFREDLFYRLNVFPIKIPPLRGRREDIIHLANHFLDRSSNIAKKSGVKFAPGAEAKLIGYQWPGNVRELENIVERAVNLVDGREIGPDLLDISSASDGMLRDVSQRGRHLEELEKQAILKMLEELKFNMSRSAKMLGISRATLYNKLKKYNLNISKANG